MKHIRLVGLVIVLVISAFLVGVSEAIEANFQTAAGPAHDSETAGNEGVAAEAGVFFNLLPPTIEISPTQISSLQPTNWMTGQTLTISNTGTTDLTWSLFEDNSPVVPGEPGSGGNITLQNFGEDGSISFLTGQNPGRPGDIALDFINQNRAALGLVPGDLDGAIIEEYYTVQTGMTQVELRQTYGGIELYNTMMLVNIAGDGSVINLHSRFVGDVAALVNTTTPVMDAETAVMQTADMLGLSITEPLEIKYTLDQPDQFTLFSDGGISQIPIPAKLVYQPGEDGLRLAWDVEIFEFNTFDWWSIRLDAVNGDQLDRANYTIHEDFLEQAALAHGHRGVEGEQQAGDSVDLEGPEAADTYRVYAWPVESPNYTSPVPPADARTLEANPAADASANASPFGWHATSTMNWTTTQGNNVDAQKGGVESNCGPTLDCDHVLDLTVAPTTGSNVDSAIDNLFYWNNIIHDVWYDYGFDEVSRNFQEDNNGMGGAGGDSVTANAQAPGNCNANMATPTDGNNPTMNMYTCNNTTPARDGDLDNGVIVHEYTHGISNRLTGGASVNCLNNAEQMGEGWSDWFALMMTIESGDAGTDSRPIGTWLLGQGPTGAGVRIYPYSTNMAVNPHTYNDVGSVPVPHGVGSIWAAMVWEVNWNLIAGGSQSGLDPDIYNGTGGNNLAMQLVMDGLKLQPCSPGFVDGRDAILLADQNLTGGLNQCLIWEGFAKRGLGFSASQGSSNNVNDGTAAFDLPPICLEVLKITKTATPDPVPAGGTLTYNLLVENDTAVTLTGVVVSDTVQANQTYVNGSATCGGSESGGVVTFPIGTMTSGASVNCSFQVTVSGSIGSTQFFFDDFEGGLGSWTTSGLWNLEGEGDTCGSQQAPFPSPTNAAYYGVDTTCTYNTGAANTGSLTMNSDIVLPGGSSPSLQFYYFLETEQLAPYDAAFVEISTNGGGTWAPLLQVTDSSWQQVTADLSAYAGSSVRLRFRFDTVDNVFNDFFGWLVDDVTIIEEATVFNQACVMANEGDNDCDSIYTMVIPSATCDAADNIPWLSAAPANGVISAGNSADVNLTFDSTGYGTGVYTGTLCIDSDDAANPQLQVPVTMTIQPVDFSDLAGSYGVAWHFGDGTLRLGSSWDADSTYGPGDDDGSDDGVVRASTPWTAGNNAAVDVTTNGAGYVAGWFDWDADGVFSAGEKAFGQSVPGAGTHTIIFIVGAAFDPGTNSQLMARFRLYSSEPLPFMGIETPDGGTADGEVEDYIWAFTPTAISLRSQQAGQNDNYLVWVIGGLLLLGVSSYEIVRRRKSV